MQSIVNQAIWSSLLFIGIQFLFIGSRLKADRSYAYYGLTLVLTTGVFFPDAWVFPKPGGSPATLFWTRATYLGIIGLIPVLLLFFLHVMRAPRPGAFKYFLAGIALAALLFLWDWAFSADLFFQVRNSQPESTPWLSLVMASCNLSFLALALQALLSGMREASGLESSRSHTLFWGWCGLGTGGLVSSFSPSLSIAFPGTVYSLWGMAVFAICGSYVLITRFLELNRENQLVTDKLASAYAQLRENAGLQELGTSAAMISHEIRNYVSTLKGNVLLMDGAGVSDGRENPLESIRHVAEKLDLMSRDIASFAFPPEPSGGIGIDLDDLLRSCIARHFQPEAGGFSLIARPGIPEVIGKPDKLEQAFVNLFRNSLEAGAGRIEIRIRSWGDRVIVAVEDDGRGCGIEELAKIGTPFFTGRAGSGGTGLGTSVAAALFKADGASLRIYSKNVLGTGRTGLVVNVVFPTFRTPSGGYGEVVIANDEPDVRACILPPVLNLGIRPYLLSGQDAAYDLMGTLNHAILFVQNAWTERDAKEVVRRAAFAADTRRVMWPAGADSGSRRRSVLLSEENLAALLSGMDD